MIVKLRNEYYIVKPGSSVLIKTSQLFFLATEHVDLVAQKRLASTPHGEPTFITISAVERIDP